MSASPQSNLTPLEFRVLVALAAGPRTGYAVRQQLEEDALGELKIGNGTIYPALDRLARLDAIDSSPVPGRTGKGAVDWRLTRTGRLMMEWELTVWRRLIRLAETRVQ
jgi:PadR family transcriptional regulator PadR